MARKSFKYWENIKRKQEAGNIHWKQEVSGQNGRDGISDFYKQCIVLDTLFIDVTNDSPYTPRPHSQNNGPMQF